uniref:Uncharacterized protein n=1 Tax=Anguilla anguilla TaxID=7936 RepID=A0A0E9X6I4_ANGAN
MFVLQYVYSICSNSLYLLRRWCFFCCFFVCFLGEGIIFGPFFKCIQSTGQEVKIQVHDTIVFIFCPLLL